MRDVETPPPDTGSHTQYKGLLEDPLELVKPNRIMYTSILCSLLTALQYGWSISQLNLTAYNNKDDCNAATIADGTCLMFPGHSEVEWLFVVNGWIFGGMVGSLCAGHFSFRYGPRATLRGVSVIAIVAAIIQASSFNVWQFAAGRFIGGLASGACSSIVGTYIQEVAPPHMRSSMGVMLPFAIATSSLIVVVSFFFAESSSGWRYIAGFPLIPSALYLIGSFTVMVESPPWLLLKGRRNEAEHELGKLFGEENLSMALGWIETTRTDSQHISSSYSDLAEDIIKPIHEGKTPALFSKSVLPQLIIGMGTIASRQLSGLNTVFYYSSTLFTDAGIQDDRIGTVVVNCVNMLPPVIGGVFATKFGNRKTLLWMSTGAFISHIGTTIALIADISELSIVFTCTFVLTLNSGLGALAWVVAADVLPDYARASGFALCVACQWFSNLFIGIGYPYISSALGSLRYVPFIVIMALIVLFLWCLVPETQGRSNEEIQGIFQDRLKRRQAVARA